MTISAKNRRNIACQAPYIGPFAAGNFKDGVIDIRHVNQFDPVDSHLAGRNNDALPRPSEIISTIAIYFHSGIAGWDLIDHADKVRQHTSNFRLRWPSIAGLSNDPF